MHPLGDWNFHVSGEIVQILVLWTVQEIGWHGLCKNMPKTYFCWRSMMIPVTLFPCLFTDGARIVGELGNALQLPVYTDQMILTELAERFGTSVERLQLNLFGRPEPGKRLRFAKEKTMNRVRDTLANLLLSSESWLYYGFFSSLLPTEQGGTLRVLVVADEGCRQQRAVRQEGVSEQAARQLIREHDQQATAWSRSLHDRDPYDPVLYDAVVTYGCQDLLDVVAYIYMLHEENDAVTGRQDVQVAARNMKLVADVENVLLQKGLRAEVKACAPSGCERLPRP